MATKSSKPFHVQVADLLIVKMKEGTAPWQKPWKAGDPFLSMPMNPTSGKRYRGINAMYLMAQGRSDQRWLTYNQAQATGAQVRKGETGTPIQYWKFSEEQIKRDEAGKPVKDEKTGELAKVIVQLERPRVFFATVFNAEQIDGMPPLQPVARDQTWTPIERAERILKASGAEIHHSEQDRAFYRPSTDKIHMPEKQLFPTADNYYATALHELGHWTGHTSRLDRDLTNPFGSEAYAREELRAEIASMILGNELGIGHDPDQHASYVKSWIKALEEDPMEIFRAAADAEKIQDFVLAFEQKQIQTQEQEQAIQAPAERIVMEKSKTQPAPSISPSDDLVASARRDLLVATANKDKSPTVEVAVTSGQVQAALREPAEVDLRSLLSVSGMTEAKVDAAVKYAAEKIITERTHVGTLVDFGAAPYLNDPKNSESFFVQFTTPAGSEQKVWGKDLDRALKTEGLKAGDAFVLAFQSAKEVVIQEKELDADGKLTGRTLDKEGIRNEWEATLLSRLAAEVENIKTADQEAFSYTAMASFGFPIPVKWDGEVQVLGMVTRDDEVIPAAQVNADPQFFALYVRESDGQQTWLMDATTEEQAKDLERRLLLIDAYSQPDTFIRDAKLARLQELWVSQNPQSTEVEKVQARDTRKTADAAALIEAAPVPAQASQTVAAPAPQQASKAERIYFKVPFSEKDEIKALGARYDRNEKKWYALPGQDITAFEKWPRIAVVSEIQAGQGAISQPSPEATLTQGQEIAPAAVETSAEKKSSQALAAPAKVEEKRQYLAVDYHQRNAAKAAGAAWDTAAKSWYVGPNADMEKLKKWLPEAVAVEQTPALNPREEFADTLRAAGFIISGSLTGADDEHPIMDGKKHRVAVEGDKSGATSGFYVGHLDDHPAGYYMNNKTGDKDKWKSKGYTLTPEQKAVMQAQTAQKLQARAEDEKQRHEQSAKRVVGQLANVKPAKADTPYIAVKGIKAYPGVFVDQQNKTMFIPAIDAQGKQWTMQYIQEDGTKRFAKDSRKDGCFHPIGGSMEALRAAPALVIGEGYATAAQVAEAVGFATVAAFDSGNLEAVAKALHEIFPDKPVIIVGDDDRHQIMTHGANPGRSKAEAAAQAVGGKAVFPIFAPSEVAYPANLPPITPEIYRAHLAAERLQSDAATGTDDTDSRKQFKQMVTAAIADVFHDGDAKMLSADQLAALAQMKKYTDFNDLATKSSLGRDGVERQLKAAVGWAIEKHVSMAEQEQAQQLEQTPKRKRVATI